MHSHEEDSSFLFLDLKRIDSFAFSFSFYSTLLLILILIFCGVAHLCLLIHPVFFSSLGFFFFLFSLFSLQQLLFSLSLSFGFLFPSIGSFNPQ